MFEANTIGGAPVISSARRWARPGNRQSKRGEGTIFSGLRHVRRRAEAPGHPADRTSTAAPDMAGDAWRLNREARIELQVETGHGQKCALASKEAASWLRRGRKDSRTSH